MANVIKEGGGSFLPLIKMAEQASYAPHQNGGTSLVRPSPKWQNKPRTPLTKMAEQASHAPHQNGRTSLARPSPKWRNKPRTPLTKMAEQASHAPHQNGGTSLVRPSPKWQNKPRTPLTKMAEQASYAPHQNGGTSLVRPSPKWRNKPRTPLTKMAEQASDALNASNRKSPRNDPRSKNTLSPVTPCAGRAGAPPNEDPRDQPNLIWSKKVRRSYSRLSDGSVDGTPSGSPLPPRTDRLSLFGFGGLCGVSPVRGGGGRSLLEGAGAGVAETSPPAAEQDFDIPGVALVKEKRRRKKKVQQIQVRKREGRREGDRERWREREIQMSELDCLAAQMNAEFDAAEEFDLCVE
ncbi:UNVERIFIED_CONTAM: hypothetical protein FKN15_025084 [Acipenser sinensis]